MNDHPIVGTPAALVANAHALTTILGDAERFGLPLPFSARADEYDISLLFRLDALTDWSLWAEMPIATNEAGTHHTINLTLAGRDVELAAVTRIEVPC